MPDLRSVAPGNDSTDPHDVRGRNGLNDRNRSNVYVTRSEEETAAVASELASALKAGDVLLLSGNLGAGKTTFVRGLAQGLGVSPDDVSSPTFTLVHEYRGGRLCLYHADLYRLDRAATAHLGLEEMGVDDGVLAVEWADRLTRRIPSAIIVDIQWVDEGTRRIIIRTSA